MSTTWSIRAALLLGMSSCLVAAQGTTVVYDESIQQVRAADLVLSEPLGNTDLAGVVVVAASLDDEGNVVSALPMTGHAELAAISVENVMQWRFVPNVQKRVVVVYDFRVEGRCHDRARHLSRLVRRNLVVVTRCGGPSRDRADRPPSVADDVSLVRFEDLRLPAISAVTMVEGVVVVSAALDDDGNVVSVTPVSGRRDLIPLSVENVRKWQFVPNAKKQVVVVYDFRVEGTCGNRLRHAFQLVHDNMAVVTGCMTPWQT